MIKPKSPALDGYNVAMPYLMVPDVEAELNFIENAFGAEIIERIYHPDGYVMHGEARIRDSVVMIGKVRKGFPPMEGMVYVFVRDAEETYLSALENDAESLKKPYLTFYGMKEAGIKDQQGIQWWIAEIVERISSEEIEKRLLETINKQP
jgi:uncharacterized glyoxalase superfamily protein PhnB